MPLIKIINIPANPTERDVQKLRQIVLTAARSVEELDLKNQNIELLTLDRISEGQIDKVLRIEVTDLRDRGHPTDEVRQKLAESLGRSVQALYPAEKIECEIEGFNPEKGFWVSSMG